MGWACRPAYAHDTVYYYYTNTLHSAVVETDAHGAVLERTYYAPYGQVLNRELRDGPGYTGKAEDPATGLVYMEARYYDPQAGRFLSTDPVLPTSDGGSFNRYAYAGDNPYRYTDPTGEMKAGADASPCRPGPYCGGGAADQGLLTVTGNVEDVDNRSGLGDAGAAGLATGNAQISNAGKKSTSASQKPGLAANGMLGPYVSRAAAAKGGLAAAAPIAEHDEYGGLLLRSGSNYYATSPATSHRSIGFEFPVTFSSAYTLAGLYHTHTPGAYDYPDYFSRDDVDTAHRLKVPSYIGIYDTHSIRYYDPSTMRPMTRSIGDGISLQGMSHGALLCSNCFP